MVATLPLFLFPFLPFFFLFSRDFPIIFLGCSFSSSSFRIEQCFSKEKCLVFEKFSKRLETIRSFSMKTGLFVRNSRVNF